MDLPNPKYEQRSSNDDRAKVDTTAREKQDEVVEVDSAPAVNEAVSPSEAVEVADHDSPSEAVEVADHDSSSEDGEVADYDSSSEAGEVADHDSSNEDGETNPVKSSYDDIGTNPLFDDDLESPVHPIDQSQAASTDVKQAEVADGPKFQDSEDVLKNAAAPPFWKTLVTTLRGIDLTRVLQVLMVTVAATALILFVYKRYIQPKQVVMG